MNWDLDELLDMVDEWKFKAHDQLKKLSPEQRAAYWKQGIENARAAGLPIFGQNTAADRRARRARRSRKRPSRAVARKKALAATTDPLLDMVDQWKFELHDKLKNMTEEQRSAFWRDSADRARAAGFQGFQVVKPGDRLEAKPKRRRRKIG